MSDTLKKAFFWNTVGVFMQNAISPLLLIVITRINGIDASGLFSFAASISIVLFAFGLWGGRTYQVSDIKQEFRHHNYIITRAILAMVMLVGALIFCWLNNYEIYKSTRIVVLVIFKMIESVADSVYGIFQVNNSLSRAGKSLFYKATFGFAAFLLADLLAHDILMGSLAIVLVNLIIFFGYDIRLAQKFGKIEVFKNGAKYHIATAIKILKRTAPVFVVTFLATFSVNIPRFFVDKFHPDQIGYFGIIAMPITLIALMMSFILQPNIVHITELYEHRKYKDFSGIVNKVVLFTLGIGVLAIVGAYLFGAPLLKLVFGVNFDNHQIELVVMVVGGVINAFIAIFITILIIMRRFKAQIYTLLLSNTALLFVCSPVVQKYGMLGGIILFSVTNFLQLAILLIAYNCIIKREQEKER